MLTNVTTFAAVPEKLVQRLTKELPYSITFLRRLQFTKFANGTTPHARIIFTSDIGDIDGESESQQPQAFTVAYVDFSVDAGPKAYLYSTLQHQNHINELSETNRGEYKKQVASVVQEIIRLGKEHGRDFGLSHPDRILAGSVHSDVRAILEQFGRVQSRETPKYDKWLFRIEELPQFQESLPAGMHWDRATLDDCRIMVSRTDIPRTAEMLMRLPSLMIKLEDKTPIAWALLGVDGSLISLHCEPKYRRRGLAKTLAAKLIRENSPRYGSDGWCSADVAATNEGSRAMCQALNGKPHWVTSWMFLILVDDASNSVTTDT